MSSSGSSLKLPHAFFSSLFHVSDKKSPKHIWKVALEERSGWACAQVLRCCQLLVKLCSFSFQKQVSVVTNPRFTSHDLSPFLIYKSSIHRSPPHLPLCVSLPPPHPALELQNHSHCIQFRFSSSISSTPNIPNGSVVREPRLTGDSNDSPAAGRWARTRRLPSNEEAEWAAQEFQDSIGRWITY